MKKIYSASPMQEGMYFHDMMSKRSLYYNQVRFGIEGELDIEVFKKSVKMLVDTHEVLRSRYYLSGEKNVMVEIIAPADKIQDVEYKDISDLDDKKIEEYIEDKVEKEKNKKINLEKGQIMNMTLYKIRNDYHILIWGCHHIALDGWCMSILIKELFDYYANGLKNVFEIKEEIPYTSYLDWLKNNDNTASKNYWKDYLDDMPESFLLATGKNDKSYSLERKCVRLNISKDKMDIVKDIAKKYHLTVSTIVQGLWGLLLCKYSNRKEAIWGCVTSGRSVNLEGIENVVGLFINTLPVVIRLDKKQSMVEQLNKLGMDIFKAEFNSNVSLNEISDRPNELFNHIFAFENLEFSDMLSGVSFGDLKIKDPRFYDRTNYDLTIKAEPKDTLAIEWHYNPYVYEKKGIVALKEGYENLVDQFIADPKKAVADYKLLSDDRQKELIDEINKNYKNKELTPMQEQFINIAKKYPNNYAITEENTNITYKSLYKRAKSVASYLQSVGVKKGDIVGIDAINNADTISCIMGILLAGCAYIALDMKLPEKRRKFFIEQTNMAFVFSNDEKKYEGLTNILNKEKAINYDASLFKEVAYSAEDLSYIIFTSGSTGEPKGVSVSSGALCSFATISDDSLQYGLPTDRVAQIAVLSFDACIYEVFTTFLTGGNLIIASSKDKENAINLTRFMREKNITRAFITTQLFQLMVDEDVTCFENARTISAGGERASAKHFSKMAKANPNVKVINTYGPTECVCFASGYHLLSDAKDMEEIPIGYPQENHTYYVLDEDGNICPPYAEGELYIGGANASCYYKRDDLTNEVFVDNPYNEGEILYKSGDMVKYIENEGMVYINRKDNQVKIRGFRIEASEIEKALEEYKDIKQALVRIVKHKESYKINAYYVADKTIEEQDLKQELSKSLPSYMIPNGYLQIKEFPMNKNGKIDIKALPDIIKDTKTAFMLPQNKIQQEILEVWQEVLDNKEIGIWHNFFEYGGDSIKAMQIIGLIKKLGYDAEIRTLFKYPTVEKFSQHITVGLGLSQESVVGECELLPIQSHFFKQGYVKQDHFNQSALLKLKESINKDSLEKIMDKIISHHDMLRSIYICDDEEKMTYTQKVREIGVKSYEIYEYKLDGNLELDKQLDEKIAKIQEKMDIKKGILSQLSLFEYKDDKYLFIAVHHLVMDGVSFRIILRDIGELIKGQLENKEIDLIPKTVSYQEYAKAIKEYRFSDLENEEMINALEKINIEKLESLTNTKKNLILSDRTSCVNVLENKQKTGLEEYIKASRGLEFADVLLAIVARSIKDVLDISNFAVDIEHNGRGFKNQSFDLSNTVGWFTSIYPFVFDNKDDDIEKFIKSVSDLQKILRKYSTEYMIKQANSNNDDSIYHIKPEICFNFLGSFDSLDNNDAPFEMVVKNINSNRSLKQATPYLLEINSLSIKGKLQIMIDYDNSVINDDSIKMLVEKIGEYADYLGDIAKEKYYEPFSLSSLQMAYYIGKQDFYELGGFTTHNYIEMETKVDIQRLNEALLKLIDNQEMLRTIVLKDGTQRVLKEVEEYKIHLEDLRGLSKEEQEARIQEERKRLSHYVFDIYKFPLFDIGGFILTDEDKYLFIGYDTIMLDSGSANLLIRDLAYYYLNPDKKPEPLEYHYRDYIHDWEHLKTEKHYEDAKRYWEEKLETFPESVKLPMICEPESVEKGHFLRKVKRYSKKEYEVLKRRSREHGMTISALLLSVYAHTMNFYSGMDKFALNLTIFNRPTFHKDIERLYGDFTSTILLDFDLSENESFWKESEKVQTTLGKALEYRIYDGIYFSRDVMRKFNYPKTKAMMPMVFTSLLFEQDIWNDVKKLGDVKWQIGQTPQVYVDFNVLEQAGELVVQMDYVSELFDEEMLQNVFSSYCSMLDDVASEREEIKLPCLTDKERKQREKYNDTYKEKTDISTLIGLFRKSVKEYPDKVALICGEDKLTYRQLNKMSDRIAYELIRNDLANSNIGVCVERKIGTIVNILGILKAGGCYVPILKEFPKERVNYIKDMASIKRILFHHEYLNLTDTVDNIDENLSKAKDSAYILFTSGSTGTPKGVEIINEAVVNTIIGANEAYEVESDDVFIGISEMSFDMSVYDIFGAFEKGSTLVMVEDIHAIEKIADLVEEYKVSVWQTVPALIQMYMGIRKEGQGSSLKHILLGGDFIPKQLAKDILEKLPQAKFMSIGGPTEISIMDICYDIKEVKDEWTSIPYGYPIRNSQIYIMDSKGRECPNEVRGEIVAGGMGIAKGYVGMPKLNKEKFINHSQYGRLFKTGDYGIFKNEGYVEICGRMDNQVKIQGMRIELGEIENVFLKHKGVSQAAAVIHEDKNGTKQIVVFVEADQKEYSVDELKAYASEYLTDYMRPSFVKIMDKIPLSKNNKIDRRSLIASIDEIKMDERKITAPKNETEKALLQIWKDVLNVDIAGVEDDFFESGGDSLKAMELLSRIKTEMKWEDLLLTDILRAGTIRNLSDFRLSGKKGSILRELSDISGNKKKVFFIHGGNGSSDSYEQIVSDIETNCDCYGIDYTKTISLSPQIISLSKLANEYSKEILNKTNKDEEISLVGWCIGGTICYEIAHILEENGYDKIKLMFIDTHRPGADTKYNYTVEGELEFIKEHSFDLDIDKLKDCISVDDLWNEAVSIIESDKDACIKAKEAFVSQTAGILMNADELSIRELVMINNFFRSTVDNAINMKLSSKLINTKAIYIKASDGSVCEKPEKWQEYFEKELEIRTINGSHFEIIEKNTQEYSKWIR